MMVWEEGNVANKTEKCPYPHGAYIVQKGDR